MADWNKLNEDDFENLIKTSLNDIPPQDIADKISPYKKAISYIILGIGLTTITLNFLLLNYILPFVGIILMVLGFRSIRSENKWFLACYVLSVLKMIFILSALILNTTIYNDILNKNEFLSILNISITLIFFICFWKALTQIKIKSEIDINTGFKLVILYCVMCFLAFLNYNGLILGLILLVIYIITLKNLYDISNKIENAGYIIKTSEVKFSNSFIIKLICIFLVISMILGYYFGNSYNMNWTEYQYKNQTSNIIDLGFPEYILKDMSDEDIKQFESAKQVVVSTNEHPINKGRIERTTSYENGKTIINEDIVYDVKELKVTSIGIELENEWKIIHYFEWIHKPNFCGTNSIQLWPAYRHYKNWILNGDISGYVFYDKDNIVYRANYEFIGEQTYKTDTFILGEQTNNDVFAGFSMPNDGENYRGYITYNIVGSIPEQDAIIDSWFNYTYQQTLLQYPAITATEKRKISGFGERGAFVTIQDALQFSPDKDGAKIR